MVTCIHVERMEDLRTACDLNRQLEDPTCVFALVSRDASQHPAKVNFGVFVLVVE